MTMKRLVLLPVVGLLLVACGGGDDDMPTSVPKDILPYATYAEHCAMPRTGDDPISGDPYDDMKGNVLEEQLWIRSWTNDLYLWYSEVPDIDPKSYATPIDYFNDLKTPVTTASGAPKDKFHFTYDTSVWENLSTAGTEASYGLNWALVAASPPRKLLVALVDPGSPAATAGLMRGTQVMTIDGVDVVNGSDVDTLNEGISPSMVGEMHTFVVQDPGATTTHTIEMTAANVAIQPVQHGGLLAGVAPDDKIGYILFTDVIAPSEKGLVDAITALQAAGATDLILDLRYNGGGYLDIASELSYMIAGPSSAGKTFEQETFNDKHPTMDPVTGQLLTPTVFESTSPGFSEPMGMALPTIGLTRLFVLTTGETCSASEAVMNGLAGIGVQVIQIGSTTCGKPYGFYPFDNCGTTYFAIQFQGNNAMGFGDYPDGFVPGGVHPGCVVDDDYTHQLGDPAEAMTAAAIYYRDHNACPPAATTQSAQATQRHAVDWNAAGALKQPKSALRTNRILGHAKAH
jgi:hypothetical protein